MSGRAAFGTTITLAGTAIANVVSIGGPPIEREMLEVTAMDSPDGYKEYVPSLKDGGEVSLSINYDPSVHGVLTDLFASDDSSELVIAWNGGGSATFSAHLTGFEPTAEVDGKLEADATFKVTGAVVWAAT